MKWIKLTPLALTIVATAAACSGESEIMADGPLAPPPADAAEPDGLTEASLTEGRISAGINLLPLRAGIDRGLRGELGCAFETGGDVILVARADVRDDDHPMAAINNDGYVETLLARQAGGFNRLEPRGATFATGGMVVYVTPADRHAPDGTERVTHDGRITVRLTDGAERTYKGEWLCGP